MEFEDVIKSGRTHLQDAVPVRLGQEFGAYAKAVSRDGERIQRSAQGLRRLGIGGTATVCRAEQPTARTSSPRDSRSLPTVLSFRDMVHTP